MLDLFILAVFFISLIIGAKRGLIVQLIHIGSFIIALVVAIIYYKPLADKFVLWIPYPGFTEGSTMTLVLDSLDVDRTFYRVFAFALIFFIVKIALQILGSMFDFLTYLPVVNSLNYLLGAVLCLVEAYIILFIGLYVLALLPVESIQSIIDSSFLTGPHVRAYTNYYEHVPKLVVYLQELGFTSKCHEIEHHVKASLDFREELSLERGLLMNKKIIIRTLEKIALYMELQAENPFKVSAYRKAAAALEADERSLSEIDDITAIKGIGKGTAAVILELLETGESSTLKELEAIVPKGLIPLMKLPGLGGKKLAKLYQELNIVDADSLKAACEAGKVRELAGFAIKTEEKILKELENFGSRKERLPIWQLEPAVLEINELLASLPEVEKFSVAGSFRRVAETSKDIDFIVATEAYEVVRESILTQLVILETIAAGDTKVSVILDRDEPVSVDFRLVKREEYATALHHFTGSKDHNVRMRQLAKSMGKKISEYGVEQEDGSIRTFETEEQFFAHFDLPFIPPTVRESGKELDRLAELDDLVQLEDIVSDLHMHTTWSDGAHSVGEMGEALIAKGYTHAVITDHSQYLKVANGLTPERLQQQKLDIDAFNMANPNFRLYRGTEMDILPDGTLDFDDEVMKDLDFVIASIHSSFTQSQDKIMARLKTAIENPYVHMIAHPTGRIVGERGGYDPDVALLIEWAAQHGKILELNANPYRLDLCIEHLQLAMEKNVPIAINTDAHAIDQLRFMDIGVKYAQKAWLKKDLIVNTWSKAQFEAFITKHK